MGVRSGPGPGPDWFEPWWPAAAPRGPAHITDGEVRPTAPPYRHLTLVYLISSLLVSQARMPDPRAAEVSNPRNNTRTRSHIAASALNGKRMSSSSPD